MVWSLTYLPLIVLLTWAAAIDVRARRIPNWICFALALSGLTCAAGGWIVLPLKQSLIGAGAGLATGIIFMALGAWGAGDAKLFAAIGAWAGPLQLLIVFAIAGLVSLMMAVVISAARGRMGVLLREGLLLGSALATGGRIRGVIAVPATGDRVRGLPFAVPLLIATVTAVAIQAVRWRGQA
jgi:prepilin peptidase CpaA